MKKTVLTSFTILCLLSTVFLIGLVFNVEPVKADPKTIYVDDDNTAGPWNGSQEHPYQNITSGLEHASEGDTVFVCNGSYYEHVVVDKAVSIIGENEETTVIDGSETGTVVQITSDNVKITGFTIQRAGSPPPRPPDYHGIHLRNANNCNITKNIITHNDYAIRLDWSSNNTITRNNITRNSDTISLDESSNNTIAQNTITNNDFGIYLIASPYNIISENKITGNRVDGISLGRASDSVLYSDYNILSENEITNNTFGIYIVTGYSNLVFENVVAGNTDQGITLSMGSLNNTITRNNVTNNYRGVYLFGPSNDKLHHNNFIDNTQQVYIKFPSYSTFWDDGYPGGGNYWSDHSMYGVDLYSGPYQNETGLDWIWDSPYIIDYRNQDNYPLMYPFVPEREEIRIAYRNLLLKFIEIHSDLNFLNSTLHELLNMTKDMQEQIDSLNSTCIELQESIDDLQEQVGLLNSTLQERINSLNSTIDNLGENVMMELSTIRNLVYVLLATTVILIATTVYLSIRKPKTKQQTR